MGLMSLSSGLPDLQRLLEGATRVVRQSALTMLTTQKVLKPGVARRASVESCQKWQTLYIGLQGFCSLLDIQKHRTERYLPVPQRHADNLVRH